MQDVILHKQQALFLYNLTTGNDTQISGFYLFHFCAVCLLTFFAVCGIMVNFGPGARARADQL
jgi:hypothetical protein